MKKTSEAFELSIVHSIEHSAEISRWKDRQLRMSARKQLFNATSPFAEATSFLRKSTDSEFFDVNSLSGCRILVVDDSQDNRKLFDRILSGIGARVELVANGAEALVSVFNHMSHPFDLIIMDICMPVMDGHEAAKRIRELGFCGPIIALTACNISGEESRCFESGCTDFRLKPIARNDLIETVVNALGK